MYFALDPLGPQLNYPALEPTEDEPWDDDDTGGDDPRRLPSARCMRDAAVQAGAGRSLVLSHTTIINIVQPESRQYSLSQWAF